MKHPNVVLGVQEWYHGTTLPRVFNIIATGINPFYRIQPDRVWDFAQGFYMTSGLAQAQEFAEFKEALTGEPPAVLAYRVTPAFWRGLWGTEFPLSGNPAWRNYIRFCRLECISKPAADFTYGPVADNIPSMIKYNQEPTVQFRNNQPLDQVAFHSPTATGRLNQIAAEGGCSLWGFAPSRGWYQTGPLPIKRS